METRNLNHLEQDMGLAADVERKGGIEYTYSGSVKDIDDEAMKVVFKSNQKLGNNEIKGKLIDEFMVLTRATNRKRVKVWSVNTPEIEYISVPAKTEDVAPTYEQPNLFS